MTSENHAFGHYQVSTCQRVVLALTRIPPLYRGTLRPSWVRLLNWIRPGPVDIKTQYGLFRVLPTTNLVESALLLHPSYNLAEIDFLKEGMAPNGTFVDIGANVGLYSVALGNYLADGGRVVAIEPNPVCCDRLRFNLAVNEIKSVTIAAVAVGDFSGRGKLEFSHNDLAIANTVRDDAGGDFPVRTLMDILDDAGVGEISGMKIDIEGFELAALRPFFNTAPAQRWPKRICIEHLLDDGEVSTLLQRCGYRVVKHTRNNSLLKLERTDR